MISVVQKDDHGELIGNPNNEGKTDGEQRQIVRRNYEQEIQNSGQRDGGRALRAWRRSTHRHGSSLDAINRAAAAAIAYRACTGIDLSKAVGETLRSSKSAIVTV